MTSFDLVIRNGVIVSGAGRATGDIAVRNGIIEAIGSFATADARAFFDARGLHVLPGIIDTHVHLREPGLTHKEDLETGTRAAALGGVTSVFDMPNTNPETTTAERIAEKVALAKGRTFADHAFYAGATAENADALGAIEKAPGCAGVKIFMGSSTGSLLIEDDATIARVLAGTRRCVAVHAEDEARLKARRIFAEYDRPETHGIWRDPECARRAVERLIALARAARRHVHVLHGTTAGEAALLKDAKDVATMETTPQHLTLTAPECYARLRSYAQMNPPIRSLEHREALWQAIADGVIDTIGSDHAPHARAEKEQAYPASPSGLPGVQTMLPLMLDHVAAGRLSLERLVQLCAENPARIFGIAGKGRIAAGFDADFALVDPAASQIIRNEDMASRCGWTPFDGIPVKGKVAATILRGHVVARDGAVIGPAIGAPVRFSA